MRLHLHSFWRISKCVGWFWGAGGDDRPKPCPPSPGCSGECSGHLSRLGLASFPDPVATSAGTREDRREEGTEATEDAGKCCPAWRAAEGRAEDGHLCELASIRMLLADLGQGQHELVVFLGLPRKASPEDKDVLEM